MFRPGAGDAYYVYQDIYISSKVGGGVDEGEPDECSHDWTSRGESKSTIFDSIRTGQSARVSVCPARSIVPVYSVEKLVKSTLQMGGAYDRPTRGYLLLHRLQSSHGREFGGSLLQ